MGSCACYDFIVPANAIARTDAGAQSIVSVLGWWDTRCWTPCSFSNFQKKFFLTWGGMPQRILKFAFCPKPGVVKILLVLPRFSSRRDFWDRGYSPQNENPRTTNSLGFSQGGSRGLGTKRRGPKMVVVQSLNAKFTDMLKKIKRKI